MVPDACSPDFTIEKLLLVSVSFIARSNPLYPVKRPSRLRIVGILKIQLRRVSRIYYRPSSNSGLGARAPIEIGRSLRLF